MATIYFKDGSYVKVAEDRIELIQVINSGVRMVEVTRSMKVKQHEGNCADLNKWNTSEDVEFIEAYNVDFITVINNIPTH